MSFPISRRPRTIRPAPMSWMTAMALFALVLTGCGATSEPSSPTAAEATPEPSVAASSVAASPTAEATASAAAEACQAELLAAVDDVIEELAPGNVDTDPPLGELAEALEAIDLEGSEGWVASSRDELVEELRESEPDVAGLWVQAQNFKGSLLGPC